MSNAKLAGLISRRPPGVRVNQLVELLFASDVTDLSHEQMLTY
jgi:hypothetical protein